MSTNIIVVNKANSIETGNDAEDKSIDMWNVKQLSMARLSNENLLVTSNAYRNEPETNDRAPPQQS